MDKNNRNTFLGRFALGILFVTFVVLLIVSFYFSNEKPVRDNVSGELSTNGLFNNERGQNVSLDTVIKDPESFYGSMISVSGEVRENLDTRGLILKSSRLNNERLLVISREMLIGIGGGPGDYVHKPDENIRVSGEVRELNLDELEQEIGVELNEDKFSNYEGKPVVIADSIIKLQTL